MHPLYKLYTPPDRKVQWPPLSKLLQISTFDTLHKSHHKTHKEKHFPLLHAIKQIIYIISKLIDSAITALTYLV